MLGLGPVPPTMTVRQVAQLLGLGLRQTYEAVQRGEIPAIRLGRRWIIPSSRLLELLGLDPAGRIDGRRADDAPAGGGTHERGHNPLPDERG